MLDGVIEAELQGSITVTSNVSYEVKPATDPSILIEYVPASPKLVL